MRAVKRNLMLAVGVVALVVTGARPAKRTTDPRATIRTGAQYTTLSKEYYLSADDFTYVRPGNNIKVNSVTIPADNRPVVDLTLTDDLDQPLDRNGKITPGAISPSFIIAWFDPAERHYTSYTTRVQTSPITGVSATQAGTDSGGTYTTDELGHVVYRFAKVLPANFDKTKTTTLGIYSSRNTTAIVGKNYIANVEYDFRPDGAAVTDKWQKMDTASASCNACHNPLAAHGGSRQDVKLCVLCHQPQTIDPDTGNTVDMKVMVHKIHMGENLPSVKAGTPYVIIGNAQSVHDFSTVAFPQDIRNCTVCHQTTAPQSSVWYTNPSRAACASCHDDINWTTGANHPAGAQADDSACASCHIPQSGQEFDASIQGAHTIPLKSVQLKGLNSAIVSVSNTAPGQKPTVVFTLKNDDGSAVDPKTLGSNLNLLMGGPTSDYAIDPIRERADGASFDGTKSTYTFTKAIPASATGTWAFSIEARRTVTLNSGTPKQQNVTEGAINPVTYAAVTDTTPQARQMVVDIAKCNVCHDQLALHGGQRLATIECVMCHNPNASDVSRRPADKGPVESIDFKRMIHRIHTGEELTQDFTVYGFGGSVNNFNEVRFPGDRRDCTKCHVNNSQRLPLGLDQIATQTPRDYYSPQQPSAAACLGCHDSRDAAAHAFVNTAPFGEACAACHGTNSEFAVDQVHAR